ncbi:sensor domain-containing phosphodiesterase [Consotaella aegiceratis]|uniref:sensor domain-containing phosphodiesterase n=1 Tax=Consotaella aegiceratis TaxID=3097961 RepID=UPI002F3EB6E0
MLHFIHEKLEAPEEVQRALKAIRGHLGMEVAYLSEFRGNQTTFRVVDAPGLSDLIKPGDVHSLDDVYCRHILEGRLPELMTATGDYALARSLPITAAVPIGAHISVPVRAPDGSSIGMFCCLSRQPNHSLNLRDLQVMRVFADLAGTQIANGIAVQQQQADAEQRVRAVLAGQGLDIVYQPIWNLHERTVRGFEALSRFATETYRTPDKWFAEAFTVGLGPDLELAAIEKALASLRRLPETVYVSVNASPDTVVCGELTKLFQSLSLDFRRVMLEITEHASVSDYQAFDEMLRPLRKAGMRLAIDDAGAGFSSLQHILQLKPDKIKLDISLTRSIDTDAARRALASALVFFAEETGCKIVAEGIETEAELATLRLLGVPYGQGYGLGRPMDIEAALTLLRIKHGQAA